MSGVVEEKPKCDYCGKQIEGEVFKVYNENWDIQEGIVICETCKFGSNEIIHGNIIIPLNDYLTNKEKCQCGCKSFFSYSDKGFLITTKLVCKDCDTEYLRDSDDIMKGFIHQKK